MNISFQNHNDPQYENLLNALIQRVFGFSFAQWHALGVWDARYESYSIIEDGRMLANVCVYKTTLLIRGSEVSALQFGAVATDPEHRGRGLSRALMEHIIQKQPCAPMFLFANPSVTEFYPRFGFKRAHERILNIPCVINNPDSNVIKCSIDTPIVMEMLEKNSCFSSVLDAVNAQPVALFHLIMDYSEDIYYLPASDALVIAQLKGNQLYLAHINARTPLSWSTLISELPFQGITSIHFGFNPDVLGVQIPCGLPVDEESIMFVRNLMLPEQFVFPSLAKT